MSGLELIGVVLGLYPILALLARNCRELRHSNPADLSTKVDVVFQISKRTIQGILESALPYQQVQRLFPSDGLENETIWQDPHIQQTLRSRLGEEKYKITVDYLERMRSLLMQLRIDLESLSHGADIHGTVGRAMTKVRTVRAGMERSPIRRKINEIKDLNAELRLMLEDRPFMVTHQQIQSQGGTLILNTSQTTGVQASELFELIRGRYTCACQRPHMIGVGCQCATCAEPLTDQLMSHSEWAFQLACHTSSEAPTEAPTTVLLEAVPDIDPDAAEIQDLCSLVEEVASQKTVRKVLIDAENNKMYMTARFNANGKKNPIMTIADLRQSGNGLAVRDRWELALRLCLAIVRLCETPWVNESWTWDVCVGQIPPNSNDMSDRAHDDVMKFPVIFREVYSAGYQTDSESIQTAVAPMQCAELLQDDEPVLTKLGLALIELALQKSMEDLRSELGSPESTAPQSVIDRCMAIKLLKTGKIQREASAAYADAVNVCIQRKFLDTDGNPSQLVSTHSTFLRRFNDTVLMPLFEVWKRY
ncbi:hypothetical protein QBC40DRAFT_296073 [Triangularia verruculosa]|uniref:DUF7580 domain-containing protein n=1 Tax=Triangularia verruculosa TaxID=2587418 RepID=A0AAN6XI13_9PEZI|nr:hypothetical protein QBC40DRAFT_296073 [Triangularia verruculosa]